MLTVLNPTLAESSDSRPALFFRVPQLLLGRLYFLAAALTADCMLLASVSRRAAIFGILAPFGIVTFAVFLGLGRTKLKQQREEIPFHLRWFTIHFACVATIWLIYLVAPRGPKYRPYALPAHIFASTVLTIAVALAVLSCLPLRSWVKTFRATGALWLVSLLAGAAAAWLRSPLQGLWGSPVTGEGSFLQNLAFRSVSTILHLLLPNAVVDSRTFVIRTERFSVFIQNKCSGLEGLGLVLVFTLVWLWYFRKENRFPQALLLIPLALVSVWVLNILRICAVILIGNAGAPEIAMVGFHSQAGWIAFTAVALTFSMATRKLAWVRSDAASGTGTSGTSTTGAMMPGDAAMEIASATKTESPATAAYLVPFLAILAASFVSKAASGYFEWLYPLRFVAAAIALWHYRAEYTKLNWRFDWVAPAVGAAIFVLWIAPTLMSRDHSTSLLGSTLASLPPYTRFAWIAFRVAAATITVPIAEELAFRGYLARRLMERDFETIPFSSINVFAVCLSSVAFGLMHGGHWLAGTLAGLAYAGVLRRHGSIGDAIVAHATSNLLIAGWVLARGDWAQW